MLPSSNSLARWQKERKGILLSGELSILYDKRVKRLILFTGFTFSLLIYLWEE